MHTHCRKCNEKLSAKEMREQQQAAEDGCTDFEPLCDDCFDLMNQQHDDFYEFSDTDPGL